MHGSYLRLYAFFKMIFLSKDYEQLPVFPKTIFCLLMRTAAVNLLSNTMCQTFLQSLPVYIKFVGGKAVKHMKVYFFNSPPPPQTSNANITSPCTVPFIV